MEENTHRRYYNSEGEVVPSVTTVCKLMNKNLTGWANYMGFRRIKVDEYVDNKARFGTYTHSICEIFFTDKTKLPDYPDCEYYDMDSYKELLYRFDYLEYTMKEKGYEIAYNELAIEGEKFGGTLDMLFYNKDKDRYVLLDLKTSKAVRHSMKIQLGGYCLLLEEKFNIKVDVVGIVLIGRHPTDPEFTNIWTRESNIHNEEIFKKLTDIYYLLDERERGECL